MKEFSKFEIATIKRTAQNVAPLVRKKNKIKEQLANLEKELYLLETQQQQWEQAIVTMTGGYTTEQLVDKVVETTNSVDKDGNPVKITKYVLKYPDTVIPVVLEMKSEYPTNDEEAREYSCPDIIEPITPVVSEEVKW